RERAARMHGPRSGVQAAWQELQAMLDDALWQMPEKYRAALVLCYLEGKSHEEAARQLGCPLATFRSRLARGRERLRADPAARGLTLSAGGFAALLAAGTAEAALPVTLVRSTLWAAARFAAGDPSATVVSDAVASLMEKGLKMMGTMRLKLG